jgi:nonribosomal peptide synthetase MxcG
MRLDEFPLTPNGKIDRKHLPEPTLKRAELDGHYVAPGDDRERAVCDVFARILELDEVGVDDDFFALGADSLDAVVAVEDIAEALGVEEFPVQTLYAHPSARSLLAALSGEADEEIDWQAETQPRIDGVQPLDRAARDGGTRGVLLLGAGGFLGPHLLASLAEATRDDGARLFALVHARSEAEGRERLKAALLAERRDLGADWERVAIVPGDIARPRLGLDESAFETVAAEIDAIVHNAALVHHLYDYAHLRDANVGGTREALRLARLAGNVPFRYVSSITTGLEQRAGALLERDDQGRVPPTGNGYGESKWVAERMVLAAGADGIPAQAIRLPRAMTALRSGATSTNDATVHLLRGCIELGAYPQWSGWEPWAPVDMLADAVADAPFEGREPAVVYPRAAIAGLARVFRATAAYGFALQPVPLTEWRARLDRAPSDNPARPVAEEHGLLDDAAAHAVGDTPPGANWLVAPQLDGPAAPPVDNEYVWRMLDYLVSIGYLTHPNQEAA